jgi:hypothetical protein
MMKATPSLPIRPLQWAALPVLGDAPPLDAGDIACLREVRDVLARHGKLARFAVHLAHRHFELAAGEILIERQGADDRSQLVTVGRRGDEREARPTTWLFEEGPEFRLADAVYCVCVEDPVKQAGCVRHGRTSSPSRVGQRQNELSIQREAEEKARQRQGWPAGRSE